MHVWYLWPQWKPDGGILRRVLPERKKQSRLRQGRGCWKDAVVLHAACGLTPALEPVPSGVANHSGLLGTEAFLGMWDFQC